MLQHVQGQDQMEAARREFLLFYVASNDFIEGVASLDGLLWHQFHADRTVKVPFRPQPSHRTAIATADFQHIVTHSRQQWKNLTPLHAKVIIMFCSVLMIRSQIDLLMGRRSIMPRQPGWSALNLGRWMPLLHR